MSAFTQYGQAQAPQPTHYGCDGGVDPMIMMIMLTMMQMLDKSSATKSTTTMTSIADPDTVGEVQMVPGSVVGGVSVTGRILVHSSGRGVQLQGELAGLAPGRHAFHVHEGRGTGDSCADALGHYYPDEEKQDYDLGSLLTRPDLGFTLVARTAPAFTLGGGGPQDIAGRALVVHAEEKGGPRVACGVINLL